jgi:hypothetical protein
MGCKKNPKPTALSSSKEQKGIIGGGSGTAHRTCLSLRGEVGSATSLYNSRGHNFHNSQCKGCPQSCAEGGDRWGEAMDRAWCGAQRESEHNCTGVTAEAAILRPGVAWRGGQPAWASYTWHKAWLGASTQYMKPRCGQGCPGSSPQSRLEAAKVPTLQLGPLDSVPPAAGPAFWRLGRI